jgi:YidC/Oxa1 family membrane protein insertase
VNDTRNLILAIALSLIVLLGWSALSEAMFPTAEQPSTKFEQGKQVRSSSPAASPPPRRNCRHHPRPQSGAA